MIARRHLGDSTAGPPITDVAANFKIACTFFTKSPLSYAEYKQQCVSLRPFVFLGVTGACVLSLMINPPKSSYWVRYSPGFYFAYIKGMFFSKSPPVFLTEKVEHQADTKTIYSELTTLRRLNTAGSDSEEE